MVGPWPSITQCTVQIFLDFSDGHNESLQFYILDSPLHQLILGPPKLILHNPHIDWVTEKVFSWSLSCITCCFLFFPDFPTVLVWYSDLKEVFTRACSTLYPSYREYDCTMNLLPGTTPGKIYALLAPKREAMTMYIKASLATMPHMAFVLPGWGWVLYCGGLHYPLLLMSTVKLDQSPNYISIMPIKVSFCQGNRWKMAFNNPHSHYEDLVPF